MTAHRTATHEAAHAIIALAFSVRPRRVIATPERACVKLPSNIAPESAACIAWAGAAATGETRIVGADAWLLIDAAERSGSDIEYLNALGFRRAHAQILRRRAEIEWLAEHLLSHPILTSKDLAALCSGDTPLSRYAHVFQNRRQKADCMVASITEITGSVHANH